jgi:hypothetical protein
MLVAGLASHRFATPRERGSIFFGASKRLLVGMVEQMDGLPQTATYHPRLLMYETVRSIDIAGLTDLP